MAISQEEGVSLTREAARALYNMAARDRVVADAIASALIRINRRLILMGWLGLN